MIWIIPALVGVFFVFSGLFSDRWGFENVLDWMMTGLLACLLSLFPIGVCVVGAMIAGIAFDTHPVEYARYHLVTIRDKDGVTGQFFLGSGVIKGDQYYFYYKTNADGSVTPDKVYAGQGVRVYEQDRSDAELVVYSWVLNRDWAWLVALPMNDGGWSYKFYVPKGTVRTGFTM